MGLFKSIYRSVKKATKAAVKTVKNAIRAVTNLFRPPKVAASAQASISGGLAASQINSMREIALRQAVPPRRYVYGIARTGGAVFFQDNANPFLYIGSAISDGPIEGIEAIYLASVAIPVDVSGNAATGSRWAGKLTVETGSGAAAQAASTLLTAAFPAFVDSTFKQNGVARVVARLDWGTDAEEHNKLWGDEYTPNYLVKGVRLYDPRDGAQDSATPATWTYSDNPALCVAHALTNAWSAALNKDYIDYDSVEAAADVCDATVTYQGDAQKTFRLAGVFQADKDLAGQISEMLESFGGSVFFSDGKYRFVADGPRSSVWTIVDRDIIEVEELTFEGEERDNYDAVSATFFDAAQNGERAQTPTYVFGGAVTFSMRENVVDLPWTPDSHSAQILAYRNIRQNRDGRSLVLRLHDAAAYLSPRDIVTVTSTRREFLNGTWEVIQKDIDAVGVVIALRGHNADALYADPTGYLV